MNLENPDPDRVQTLITLNESQMLYCCATRSVSCDLGCPANEVIINHIQMICIKVLTGIPQRIYTKFTASTCPMIDLKGRGINAFKGYTFIIPLHAA
jgi:hypothetical protein